ncbi:MAG: hypothetical protein ACXW03_10885 [Methylobacter sp.]
MHGEAKFAAVAFKSHLLASVELLLFILVSSMTRLNAMEERGISTLFVWQNKIMSFHKFFSFAVPCLVNFLLPCSRHAFFSSPKETPAASTSTLGFAVKASGLFYFSI